jgi:hypothetical protein
VFWVPADNETTFLQHYRFIAEKLELRGDLDDAELLAAARGRIEADHSEVGMKAKPGSRVR